VFAHRRFTLHASGTRSKLLQRTKLLGSIAFQEFW
jgi:hypothetical protein